MKRYNSTANTSLNFKSPNEVVSKYFSKCNICCEIIKIAVFSSKNRDIYITKSLPLFCRTIRDFGGQGGLPLAQSLQSKVYYDTLLPPLAVEVWLNTSAVPLYILSERHADGKPCSKRKKAKNCLAKFPFLLYTFTNRS